MNLYLKYWGNLFLFAGLVHHACADMGPLPAARDVFSRPFSPVFSLVSTKTLPASAPVPLDLKIPATFEWRLPTAPSVFEYDDMTSVDAPPWTQAPQSILDVATWSIYETWTHAAPAAEAHPPVIVRPPTVPDSASLVLWAFGGMGLWRLGRSLRQGQLHAAPEWYHTGGPTQIGHQVRFNPQFDFAPAALRAPLRPDETPPPTTWFLRESDRIHHPHRFLRAAAPRGPPCFQ